jgi:hypothetical protein
VDVNARNKYGITPLHWAISRNDPNIVKLLLKASGIDVNAKEDEYGKTPLHIAAARGSPELVKLLLQKKDVNLNAQDNYGYTPLHGAARSKSLELVELFLQAKGIKVNAKTKYGETPLHWAVLYQHPEEFKKTLIRFDASVDPEKLTDQEKTALRTLIQETRKETEDVLLKISPSLPKDLAEEISRMVIPDADKLSKQEKIKN